MKHRILSIVSSVMLAASAFAQEEGLFINVDPVTQTYFLSGTATGVPDQFPLLPHVYAVFWDNAQPFSSDGDFADFLSASAFTVIGHDAFDFKFFFHQAGNVNGEFKFLSPNPLTLTGNPDEVFHYSGWSETLAAELEDKAANGETVGLKYGSPEFALTFRWAEPVAPEALSWSGVLPPINPDGSSVFKAGRVVPVKFQLTEESAGITDLEAYLSFSKLSDTVAGPVNEADSRATADSGNLFRYDPVTGQYILNWDTRGLSPGTYELSIDLGDEAENTVIVSLR